MQVIQQICPAMYVTDGVYAQAGGHGGFGWTGKQPHAAGHGIPGRSRKPPRTVEPATSASGGG